MDPAVLHQLHRRWPGPPPATAETCRTECSSPRSRPGRAGCGRQGTYSDVSDGRPASTCRTNYRSSRRVPAPGHHQAPPGPLALVLQLPATHPTRITDRLGQAPVLDHSCDVQVLNGDHIMVADQVRAGAVQKIRPGVADLAVRTGDLRFRLGPVVRALLTAGHPALVARFFSLRARCCGFAIFSPYEGHRKCFTARSTPTARPVAIGAGCSVSTANVTDRRVRLPARQSPS